MCVLLPWIISCFTFVMGYTEKPVMTDVDITRIKKPLLLNEIRSISKEGHVLTNTAKEALYNIVR